MKAFVVCEMRPVLWRISYDLVVWTITHMTGSSPMGAARRPSQQLSLLASLTGHAFLCTVGKIRN